MFYSFLFYAKYANAFFAMLNDNINDNVNSNINDNDNITIYI